MGWCGGGTNIFDAMVEKILDMGLPSETAKELIVALIDTLQDNDWDCESDSKFINDHPFVNKIFREKFPDWDWFNESED